MFVYLFELMFNVPVQCTCTCITSSKVLYLVGLTSNKMIDQSVMYKLCLEAQSVYLFL